jgi:ribonuclease P/MRP protein subunit RPP1
MRKFADLHVCPGDPESMLEKARLLGYNMVGVCGADVSGEYGVDIASRVNISPKNLNELSRQLKKLRRRVVVLSVECSSVKIARQAAKDHRVDILRFPLDRERRRKVWFDRHEATMASTSNAVYEICLSDILGVGSGMLSSMLTTWRRELENAFKHDIPVIVSSGATSAQGLRGPLALASIMALLDVEEERALDMVSTTPQLIVERNRGKLDPGFVLPGVRVP